MVDSSGNNKIIINQTQPYSGSLPRQDFNEGDFNSLIYQKGYDVFHEQAILCPCKSQVSDNQSSCKNCGGTGWIFLDKIKTRMLLFSMNLQTKYKEWSEEKLGTVSISCMDKDKISFMDKITLIDSDSIHKQIIYPVFLYGKLFSYLNYNAKEVLSCFLFKTVDNKLFKIPSTDYSISNNVFYLDNKYYKDEKTLLSISITYRHYNTYHVLDTTRDVINSFIVNDVSGIEESKRLPLSGVARKAHYILDPQKFNNVYILDNTTLTENDSYKC
jgi:hypothetical protein